MTRVLIVEDEESFADPLAFLLRKEGFTTAIAATGQDALEEFDRNGADIVLLDLMLPGMSGTDVCKALRLRSAVPVIMVTARDSEIDKVVGLELGADDYVTKPYSARELIARVRAVLRRGDGSAGLRRAEPGARGRTGPDGRGAARRHGSQCRGPAAAQGVRPARVPAAQRRPSAHPRSAHRPGLGRGLRRATPRRWTCTSSGCARRSRPIRRGRSTWSPCAGSATSTSPDRSSVLLVRLGVLDVGSNTVHLLVVDAHRGGHPTPMNSEKTVLRLAEHLDSQGRITPAGADALVDTVQRRAGVGRRRRVRGSARFCDLGATGCHERDRGAHPGPGGNRGGAAGAAGRGRGAVHLSGGAPLVRMVCRHPARARHRWRLFGAGCRA